MRGAEQAAAGGRVKSAQARLTIAQIHRSGRLGLTWFRAYFAASRNSGCAVTVYLSLSVGGTIATSPLFLAAPLNENGRSFGSFGVALTIVGYGFVMLTMSLVCAVFSPVWADWRETEKQRRNAGSLIAEATQEANKA